MSDSKVRVVSPDGTRGEIPRAQLMEAISRGFKPEADFDAQQRESALQAEYGGALGGAAAVSQGASRGLTLGLSDVASAALTGALTPDAPQLTPEARQRMAELGIDAPAAKGSFATGYDAAREYQEGVRAANPTLALGSEIGGALLPSLASGGLSLAPAALAERAGAAAGRTVAGAAPTLGRAVAAGAARGAVEGGIAGLSIGATRATSETTPEEAAETAISAAGEGLLLGAGIGGVLGGGAHLLRGAGQRLEGAQLTQRPPEAGPVAPTEVLPGGRHPSDIDGITLDLEARPLTAAQLPDPPRGKFATLLQRQQAAQGGFDQAVADGTVALRADVDGVLREINQVDEFAGIAAKREANALNVGHPVGTQEVDDVLGAMQRNAEAFRMRNSAAALAYDGGLNALERVDNVMADQGAMVRQSLARGDIGEAYAQLDNLKRTIGRARATRSSSVQDLMEQQYKQIQGFMEDESVWGELAQRQRAANAAWSARISAGKDARLRSFTSEAGGVGNKAANEWDQLKLSNSSSLNSLLQNVGDPRIADVEEAFRANLRATARDAVERTKAWGSPELRAKAEGIVNAVKRIEDRMDSVALLRRDAMAGAQQLRSSAVDALASVAGVLNPVAGFAITGTARVGRGLLAGVADAGSGVRMRIAAGAAALAQGAARVATVGAAKAPVVAGEVGGGMLARDKFEQAIQDAQQLTQAGSPATQELFRQGAELEKEDPQLADAYVTRQVQRAAYVHSKLPPPPSTDAVFTARPMLDPITERKLQRSVAAAYEPTKAIERIANLVGTPEDLDALRTLYPAMLKSFQAQARAHLEQLPKPLDYQTAVKVAQLTGLTTVPGMAPAAIARAQRAAAGPDKTRQAEGAAEAKRKASAPHFSRDRDNVYASHADRLMARE